MSNEQTNQSGQQASQSNQTQAAQTQQTQSTQTQRVFPDADTSVNARFNKGENSEPLEKKDRR